MALPHNPSVVAEGDDLPTPPLPPEKKQSFVDGEHSSKLMAMLHQIAAEQTATSNRLKQLEQTQLTIGGRGEFGCGHAPVHSAMDQAVAKERSERSVKVWLSQEGPKAYLLRGSYHVPEQMTTELLQQILRKIAEVTGPMSQQLRDMANFDLRNFIPPIPPGRVARALSAEDHLSTFVAALLAVVEYGMENAPAMCTTRVDLLRTELQAAAAQVSNFLSYHRPELAGDDGMLRECALSAGNDDLREAFAELNVMGGDMRRRYAHNAPPSGTGPIVNPPKFRRLMTLVDEDNEMNLVALGAMRNEQAAQAAAEASKAAVQAQTRQAPHDEERNTEGTMPETEVGGLGKRKRPIEKQLFEHRRNASPRRQPRVFEPDMVQTGVNSASGSWKTDFKRALMVWDVPRGACAHHWKGGTCHRSNCTFDHTLVHPNVLNGTWEPAGRLD